MCKEMVKGIKESIKQNFAYQMIYEMLVLILPIITSPYVARIIGAEGVGTFSFSYSVAYYFVLFSLLGIKNYGNRAIARVRDKKRELDKTFSNICTLHICISIVCCIAYVCYICTLQDGQIFALIQSLFVLSGLFDISWFYFGIENFKLTVACSVAVRLLNVSCIFIFIKGVDDLWKYCFIMAGGNLISQIVLWFPLHKYVHFIRPSWAEMKLHIKPLLTLFIPSIAVSIYKYMDKIMIGVMNSKTQLGFYENAEKVINIPLNVIASFGTVMLPKMSNLAVSSDQKAARRYMALSVEFVMCLAIALAFGLASVGRVFALIFWGKDFVLSGIIIMGLSITIPFIAFANIIRTQYLIPREKDREYLISVVTGAIMNLLVNMHLIPVFGAIGAIVGTVVAEIIVCLIQCFTIRKELPLGSYVKSFLFFIFSGAIMFMVVNWVGNRIGTTLIALVVQVLVGSVLYSGLAFAHFVRKKNEVVMEMVGKLCRWYKL